MVGLLPSVLVDEHRFWLDDNDNIRGYPLRDPKTGLYPHVLLIEIHKPAAHPGTGRSPFEKQRQIVASSTAFSSAS
jgi:hypothetical protein